MGTYVSMSEVSPHECNKHTGERAEYDPLHSAIALDLRLWCRSKSLVSYFTVHFPHHITVKEPIKSAYPVL